MFVCAFVCLHVLLHGCVSSVCFCMVYYVFVCHCVLVYVCMCFFRISTKKGDTEDDWGKSWPSRQDFHVKDAEEAGAPAALAPAGAKDSALAMSVSLALAQAIAKTAAGKRYTMGIPAPKFQISHMISEPASVLSQQPHQMLQQMKL